MEYKSAEDQMNIDTLYKVIAYGCLYKAYAKEVDGISADDITLSLVRKRKPVKLFSVAVQKLQKKSEKIYADAVMSVVTQANHKQITNIKKEDAVMYGELLQELVHKYLQFLHSLFKSEESKTYLALAYITGILPIKKIKDESSLNNFEEYTMLKSKMLTEFYGFTENEVKVLSFGISGI